MCKMSRLFAVREMPLVARCLMGTIVCLSLTRLMLFGAPRTSEEHHTPQLDLGFQMMYELRFAEAREVLQAYQRAQPQDPMGTAAEAASYLFDEFNRKGVLTSAFFLDDDRLLGGVTGPPDTQINAAFLETVRRTRNAAERLLKINPANPDALLALTLSDGMQADFTALIAKRQIESLGLMRRAQHEAATLLQVAPDSYDAYFAIGMADYVIGCLPGYERLFLWFGGFHGDRQRGMSALEKTAANGHYLKPLAKAFLALALEREHEFARARALFEELHRQFPDNPVFAHEMELAAKHAVTSGVQPVESGRK